MSHMAETMLAGATENTRSSSKRISLGLMVAIVACAGCEWGTLGGGSGKLDAPTNLSVGAISSGQLVVSWTDRSTDEDGFTVERAPDVGGSAGTWSVAGETGASVTNFNDQGLTEATIYWYRVYARSTSLGNSSKTGPVAGTTRLAAPDAVTLTAETSPFVRIQWTDRSSKEDGFVIERANNVAGATPQEDRPGTWTEVNRVDANVSTYDDATVVVDTKYWYRLYAHSTTFGDSNFTSHTSVVVP